MRKKLIPIVVWIVAAGCGGRAVPGDRPADGLLEHPRLQKIVDLQVERDGEALTGHLDHEDPAVRARAAFALGSVQYGGAVPLLEDLLEDPDPQVRADAAFAIGQTADSLSAAALLRALRGDRDAAVRRRCLEALGKTGGHLSLGGMIALDLGPDLLPELSLTVARYGMRDINNAAAAELLARFLTAPDPLLRSNAAYYFGRSARTEPWSGVVDEVRAALDGYGRGERAAMYLLQGLSRIGDPVDTGRFIHWSRRSSDWRVRTNAVRALGARLAAEQARGALFEALDDPSVHVSVAGAQALAGTGRLPPPDTERIREWIDGHPLQWQVSGALLPLVGAEGDIEFVITWMGSQPSERSGSRSMGFNALSLAPGPEAFDLLAGAADSEDEATASAATAALAGRWRRERVNETDTGAYYGLFSEVLRRGELGAVLAVAPVLADTLFLPLGSVELMVDAYRLMEVPADVEAMVSVLRSLGRTGDAAAVPLLMEASGHNYPLIRQAAAAALAGITGEQLDPGEEANPAERRVDWDYLRSVGPKPLLRLETEKGAVAVMLCTEEAPLTVQTITRLAGEGRYDGVAFHRVVPNFVVQGGDFERGDGLGGPGFAIRSEFTRIPYMRGVIGMASAGKDTEGSQYFLTHSMQPHLDGRYTAFGYVVSGVDVVDLIAQGDRVVRATVEFRP